MLRYPFPNLARQPLIRPFAAERQRQPLRPRLDIQPRAVGELDDRLLVARAQDGGDGLALERLGCVAGFLFELGEVGSSFQQTYRVLSQRR